MRIVIFFVLAITLSIVAAPMQAYGNDYVYFRVTGPTIKSLYGDVLSRSGGSQQVTLEYTLKNVMSQPFDKPVIAITEIRDSDGVTMYLALQTVDLAPDETSTISSSWSLPYDAHVGDVYQIRFFVVSSLSTPETLAGVIAADIRIDSTTPFVIVQMLR